MMLLCKLTVLSGIFLQYAPSLTDEFPGFVWLLVLVSCLALGTTIALVRQNVILKDVRLQKNIQNKRIAKEEIEALEKLKKELSVEKAKLKASNEDLQSRERNLYSREKKLKEQTTKLNNQEAILKREKGVLANKLQSEKELLLKKFQADFHDKEKELNASYEVRLVKQKEALSEKYNAKMLSFMESATQKMEQRIYSDKKELLDDVFNFDGESDDDFFEMKQLKESLAQEKEEIEKDRLLVEIDQRVSKASEHVLNAKSTALEVKSENVDLRSELKLMASDFKMDLTKEQLSREIAVDSMLHKLELEQEKRKADQQRISSQLQIMDAQTKAKLVELKSSLSHALKDLQLSMANSFREVREHLSDMKLQFGQEIMRLDGQQGQILTELEKYYAKNQQFVNQCQSLALEAKSQNLDGQNILQKVNTLYSQHKLNSRDIESQLRSSMEQVSLKEGQLANSVGESMLKLKGISDQQYSAMKELALEKKDVNLLWREKNEEHENNLQEVRHQKQDLDMTRKLLGQEQSSFNQHRADVMGNARLTHRNYMQEQEYKMALWKADNSGGWLSQWARNFENSSR